MPTKDKQPYRVPLEKFHDAVKLKVQNDWTAEEFRDHLSSTCADDNVWEGGDYKEPPVLSTQRCRAMMTALKNDKEKVYNWSTKEKEKLSFKSPPTKADIRKAELKKKKESFAAEMKQVIAG